MNALNAEMEMELGWPEIEELEDREANARVAADVKALEQLWGDELLINATENIIYNKAQFLVRLMRGQLRFNSFQRKPSKIVVAGNVAISSGNESIAPAGGPDENTGVHCNYMNVWLHRASGWKLIGRQVAVIARSEMGENWSM